MNYWLVKSEADCYSIDDLKKDKKTAWTGIRNYQARNFMRDSMKIGDPVLFYHSGGNPPSVVGVAEVASLPHPDTTALDTSNDHFDPKSTIENPMWMCVDIKFVSKFKNPVTLPQIRFSRDLDDMMLVQRGSRLSVQPVLKRHFDTILKMSENK
ncbi:MAG: EVE domain-containing protein [Patescibacteria group bacterium]